MTEYRHIDVENLVSNPFQTRKGHNEEIITGIAESAKDHLGIRNPIMVRPLKDGTYQIASGEGRWKAAKQAGLTTIPCRIEDLSDSDMKKEVLVENVNRGDLTEDELYAALEQYREELNLQKGKYAELSRETGVPETTIGTLYDVKNIREKLIVPPQGDLQEKPTAYTIKETRGLETEDRVKLVEKAQEEEWSGRSVGKVKTAIKDVEPKVRKKILEAPKRTLTPTVIEKVVELKPEQQEEVLDQIQTWRMREDDALKTIERVKTGTQPQITIVVNEYEDVLNRIRDTTMRIKLWGSAHYGILGDAGWAEAARYFTEIEDHMRYLKTKAW